MLNSEDTKFKYPSFRIDDILNNNFGSNLGKNLVLIKQKNDHPINLSLRNCLNKNIHQNKDAFLIDNDFFQNKPESPISPKSSYSPNSSISSYNESSDFDKYSLTNLNEKIIKYSFNNYFKTSDTNDLSSTLIYTDNCINEFTCQNQSNILINKSKQKLDNKNSFYEPPYFMNKKSFDLDASKFFYKNENIEKNELLPNFNEEKYPNFDVPFPIEPNYLPKIHNSNSNFYLQQLYIKMKMLMHSKPRKGGQIRFNNCQTKELENLFNTKRYLMPSDRKLIAKRLNLSERQVKTWFQNRRAKWRKIKDNQQ